MPSHSDIPSRCRAQIDLSALEENARALRMIWGDDRGLMGIVKADAYGHGLGAIATALSAQVEMFGVASLDEAMQLKQVLGESEKDIFLLGSVLPREREAVVENGLLASVTHPEEAAAFSSLAADKGKSARVHLAIDTGMGRLGMGEMEFGEMLQAFGAFEHLSIEGLFSHFPVADEQEQTYTLDQIERFRKAVELFRKHFPDAAHIHIANSAGLLRYARQLDFTTLARPGLALYGVAPGGFGQQGLKPVMTLKTEIALIRELPPGQSISYGRTFITSRDPVTRVATLAAGYGDGYLRQLSHSGAEVLIGGHRCPLLGTVTMDQILVDVSGLNPSAKPGDEAILIGRQGMDEITAREMAEQAATIPWQVFTGISKRVDREFFY